MIRPVAWRGWTVLIAVLLSLGTGTLVGLAMSQTPVPGRGNKTDQQAASQPQQNQAKSADIQRGSESNPLIVQTQQTQNQSADDQRDRLDQKKNRWANSALVFLTFVVIVLQCIYLKLQNDIMVEQSGHMIAGLAETKKAADASTKSADTAANALVATQRSFLLVDKILSHRMVNNDGETTGVKFAVRWKNSGPTPAIDIRTGLAVIYFGPQGVFHTDMRGFDDEIRSDHAATCGPGGALSVMGSEIPIGELKAHSAGTKPSFYIVAGVHYRDIFTGTRVHRTAVSVVPDIQFRPGRTWPEFGYPARGPYNYAD